MSITHKHHSTRQNRPGILVVAREHLVGTLLSTFSEVEGYRAESPRNDETLWQAVERVEPAIVLVDCDRDEACEEEFLDAVAGRGIGVVLFSPGRLDEDVHQVAMSRRLPYISFPMDHRQLGRVLAMAQQRGGAVMDDGMEQARGA